MSKHHSREIHVSEHAKQRLEERLGIKGKKEVKDFVQKAFKKGVCFRKHHIPKKTLTFIERKIKGNLSLVQMSKWRIYKGNLLLFSNSLKLITIYPLPKELDVVVKMPHRF